MDSPTRDDPAAQPTDDPAVRFLTGLLPNGELQRRRVFSALLRAVLAEGRSKR